MQRAFLMRGVMSVQIQELLKIVKQVIGYMALAILVVWQVRIQAT